MNRQFYSPTTNPSNLPDTYTTASINFGTYLVRLSYLGIVYRNCNASSTPWYHFPTDDCYTNCNTTSLPVETNPGAFCSGCNYTCKTCSSGLVYQCTDCEPLFHRGSSVVVVDATHKYCPCISGYVDTGVSLCTLCSQVITGCNTCTNTTFCTGCLPGFSLLASGRCDCNGGFLITGVCTTVIGCISAYDFSGSVQCLACNSTRYFNLTNSSYCSCITGFYMNGSQCLYKCGDGILVAGQACDDKNTINGDGCSSACQIEMPWHCDNTLMPSKCTKIIVASLTLLYVRRITTSNTMEVAYQIIPFISDLSKFTSLVTSNVPYTKLSTTYSNSILTLLFDYNQTLEGNNYSFSLTLDPDLYFNNTIQATLPATGMNAKLTLDTYYSHNLPLQILIYILDSLALVVFIISAFSQRWIGVQMIQTIQSVFFTMSFMKSCPSMLSPLQQLRYSNGYNFQAGTDYSRIYTYSNSISQLGIEKQFLLSFNLMYIFLFLIAVILVLLKIIVYILNSRLKNKGTYDQNISKQLDKIQKFQRIVFRRIFFLLGNLCFFTICFAIAIQLTDMLPLFYLIPRQINLLAVGIVIVIQGFLMGSIIVNSLYPQSSLYSNLFNSKNYPMFYIAYQTIFIFILGFAFTQTFMIYALSAFIFLNIIITLVLRPYIQLKHTIALIFHQIVILFGLSIYLFEDLTRNTDNSFQRLFLSSSYLIVALLYIVVFWNGYRLWRIRKYNEVNEHIDAMQKNKKQEYQTLKSSLNSRDRKDKVIELAQIDKNNNDFDWKYPNEDYIQTARHQKPIDKQQLYQKNLKSTGQQKKKSDLLIQKNSNPKYESPNLINTHQNQPSDFNQDKKAPITQFSRPYRNSFNLSPNSNINQMQYFKRDSRLHPNQRIYPQNNIIQISPVKIQGQIQQIQQSGQKVQQSGQKDKIQGNEFVFSKEGPYDEFGYAKKVQIDYEDDQLKRIKMRLRKQLNKKLQRSKQRIQ